MSKIIEFEFGAKSYERFIEVWFYWKWTSGPSAIGCEQSANFVFEFEQNRSWL